MPLLRNLAALALIPALAACGSSSNGSSDTPSYEDYVDEGERIFDETQTLGHTDPSALPTGSATYNGVVALGDEDDYAVAGDLSAGVTFGTGDISGSITNIVDTDGVAYSGSLTIDDGFIDTAADPDFEDTFGAEFGGTLTGDGETFVVAGEMYGDFIGPNAEYMEGEAYTEVCEAVDDCFFLDGDFIAER